MIVDNIEKLTSPVSYWKFIKIQTHACPFLELAERIEPLLYDGRKLNSIFPFNCDALPETGVLAVILLAQGLDRISELKESLKELGVQWD